LTTANTPIQHIALSAHAGGPSHYDIGGDNSGYGEDRSMIFSARIERIIKLLTVSLAHMTLPRVELSATDTTSQLDKDIAMDVIEGRGVKALVYNPNKYERVSIFLHPIHVSDRLANVSVKRKRDNKKSNDTKQDLQEKGKQYDMLEASTSGSPPPMLDPALVQYEIPTQLSGDTDGIAGLLLALADNSGGDGGGAAGYMDRYPPARFD
jgi:hypothetical protein